MIASRGVRSDDGWHFTAVLTWLCEQPDFPESDQDVSDPPRPTGSWPDAARSRRCSAWLLVRRRFLSGSVCPKCHPYGTLRRYCVPAPGNRRRPSWGREWVIAEEHLVHATGQSRADAHNESTCKRGGAKRLFGDPSDSDVHAREPGRHEQASVYNVEPTASYAGIEAIGIGHVDERRPSRRTNFRTALRLEVCSGHGHDPRLTARISHQCVGLESLIHRRFSATRKARWRTSVRRRPRPVWR